MALELVFECPRTLKKLRNGPLGKLLDRFCDWLLEHGFVRTKPSRHQEEGGLAIPEWTWEAAELCAVNCEKMKTIRERRSFTSHNSELHITRPYSTEQRRFGTSAIHATAFDRVRGELQSTSPPLGSSISESLQIDRL